MANMAAILVLTREIRRCTKCDYMSSSYMNCDVPVKAGISQVFQIQICPDSNHIFSPSADRLWWSV